MIGITFVMLALGVLLSFLGIVLIARRIKIPGIIIALLGLAVLAVPVFAFLYVVVAMR